MLLAIGAILRDSNVLAALTLAAHGEHPVVYVTKVKLHETIKPHGIFYIIDGTLKENNDAGSAMWVVAFSARLVSLNQATVASLRIRTCKSAAKKKFVMSEDVAANLDTLDGDDKLWLWELRSVVAESKWVPRKSERLWSRFAAKDVVVRHFGRKRSHSSPSQDHGSDSARGNIMDALQASRALPTPPSPWSPRTGTARMASSLPAPSPSSLSASTGGCESGGGLDDDGDGVHDTDGEASSNALDALARGTKRNRSDVSVAEWTPWGHSEETFTRDRWVQMRRSYGAEPHLSVPQDTPGHVPFPQPKVTCLDEMFGFAYDDLLALRRLCSPGVLHYMAENMRSMTVSSSCSGIDAPGVGDGMYLACLSTLLHRDVDGMTHLSAVELSPECRSELMAHPAAPKCIYEDQNDFFTPGVAAKLADFKDKGVKVSIESMMPLIKSGTAVRESAYCTVHRRDCECQRAQLHRAGLPCVAVHGESTHTFASWMGMRRLIQEPIVIVENSDHFAPEILEEGLGDIYILQWLSICGTDRGEPVRRRRFWGVLLHRGLILEIYAPFRQVVPMFFRTVDCSWNRHERKRASIVFQAGNSMNVSVSAIVTLYCLVFVRRADQSMLADWFDEPPRKLQLRR